ncbi:MAG TPA: NADH-quinone oxidoreductase subunit C [Flavisolibacter sp.]|jgi:NADH-quinone oxidoreductase subunit C|nr:NADH-quinone oxidoreductase subunit C [Flavisolibacter sp.]
MALTNEVIKQRLVEKFGEQVSSFEEPYGMLTFEAPKELNLKVLGFLYDDEDLKFRFLTDLTVVHYPAYKGRELAVVYHLHNLVDNIRIRFKVFSGIAQPDVYTATQLFSSANWQEREAYDFYGVNFVGHPNLKRIMNVDEMDYFPMRKEFPLEDQTRIDKDDEMFGRGGSLGFGNEPTPDHHHSIAEENKKADQEILNKGESNAQFN